MWSPRDGQTCDATCIERTANHAERKYIYFLSDHQFRTDIVNFPSSSFVRLTLFFFRFNRSNALLWCAASSTNYFNSAHKNFEKYSLNFARESLKRLKRCHLLISLVQRFMKAKEKCIFSLIFIFFISVFFLWLFLASFDRIVNEIIFFFFFFMFLSAPLCGCLSYFDAFVAFSLVHFVRFILLLLLLIASSLLHFCFNKFNLGRIHVIGIFSWSFVGVRVCACDCVSKRTHKRTKRIEREPEKRTKKQEEEAKKWKPRKRRHKMKHDLILNESVGPVFHFVTGFGVNVFTACSFSVAHLLARPVD